MRTSGGRFAFALAACLWLLAAAARAESSAFLPSLAEAALSENVPSAAPPAPFDAYDFKLVRVDGDEHLARVWLEPGSVRWVRTGHVAVVPRGLLVVQVKGATAGSVSHGGFTHPLAKAPGGMRALVPVALLSTDNATIELHVVRGAVTTRVSYAVRFQPRPENQRKVAVDASCSPYGLHVSAGELPADTWLNVLCRMVRTGRAELTSATLELYITFDNAGAAVTVNDVPTAAQGTSLYTVRITGEPGTLRIGARGHALTLRYFVPKQLHAGFIGAGVGPYYYLYTRPEHKAETVVPMITLYGGYSFTPAARVVYFSAIAAHRRGFADQGLYIWLEQTRFFDDRISVNLLLGANLLVFHRVHKFVARVSAPQGAEVIFRDFGGVGRSLTAGGFLYPQIAGRSYYNGWLRWGSFKFFGEVNYLEWTEPHRTGPTRVRTLGVSFGMPLLRFL